MPIYEYKGLNKKGKQVSGLVDADSPRSLKDRLERQGTFLTRYVETDRGGEKRTVGGEQAASREVQFSFFKRIKILEVAEVTRQIATLLRSGIPVVETLGALSEQLDNPKFKRVLSTVKRSVSEGSTLADALRAHPTVFPPLYTNMVAAGEQSGNLDAVFDRLADFTEGQVRLRAKLTSAMMYPTIMLILAFVLILVMIFLVIPRMREIFEEMGAKLPWITRLLVEGSPYGVLIMALLVAAGFGIFMWGKTPAGKPKWDAFVLRIWVFGKLIRMLAIARFSRTLSTLLKSGVPILTAMNIVKSVVTNHRLAEVIEKAREAVREGQAIAEPLRASGQFPAMVTHMIAVGERSGQLEEMLGHVAESYELQVDSKIGQLSSVLEPVMILMMGAGVAFMVFAILMPMMEMSQMIAGKGG